ncbi:DNA polymerase III subunit epsilon [Pseudahrensia aquimaris]|uniref:DNA polymerase III subunit epsilon n=1 Tax=Pseudahrensia aquimaris TaxID=744461 RepID=A0ABW3FG77_9HYPH
MREIIFDTETTGLNAREGDRIIEIGAVELINRFPTGKTFHIYLNPGDREVHPDAKAVHGISNEDLKDKPFFENVIDEFMDFFGEGALVAHNAKFDMGFFNAEMTRAGLTPFDPARVIDTLEIARRKFPGARASLDALCSRFGISNAHRTLHGALLDSELLAEVYLELTGGRQAGLGFDDGEEQSANARVSPGSYAPQKQRPGKLPPRISRQELQAHAEFVEKMGEAALWKKWISKKAS